MGNAVANTNVLYSTPLENSAKPGESQVYRHPDFTEELLKTSKTTKTLQCVWSNNFKNHKDKKFLGYRPLNSKNEPENYFNWQTFGQIEDQVKKIGSGIINLDLCPEISEYQNYNLKMFAVYSKNSCEWIILDAVACMYGLTTIPIYDTLGEEATEFMFKQTNLTTCFLTCNHIKGLLASWKNGNTGSLKNFIIMDEEFLSDNQKEELTDNGVIWKTFSEVSASGAENLQDYRTVNPEDIYTFSYTSGTTGEPKGALVSHRNLATMMEGIKYLLFKNKPDTMVHLSYLPLAHVFERVVMTQVLADAGQYGIFGGNVQKLTEDLAILQPNIFASVPRLFNRFYDVIIGSVRKMSDSVKFVFNKGFLVKKNNLLKTGRTSHFLYDKIVFNRMKSHLGGKVKLMITASAPIDPEVLTFLRVCLCSPLLEAYGQTEGIGGEFFTNEFDGSIGHVGGPNPCNEFKLVDVPEMKYTSQDQNECGVLTPRGEICVRGPNVIPGYYKNEEKTLESVDEEGWLHSGDIGAILPYTNALKIIDRKKNIFKLSIGEYIAPDKLEGTFKLAISIADIFVYGDSLKACLVAIVQLDKKMFSEMAETKGLTGECFEIANTPEGKKLILDDLNLAATNGKLKGFERIKDIYVTEKSFEDCDLVTTSFKIKRNDAKEYFIEQINKMYEKLS